MKSRIGATTLPESPGAYVVYERADDERPLYVGLAARQSLRARWSRNHLSRRAGTSALRRTLGVHLGLVSTKLKRPSRCYTDDVERRITAFLENCWIELFPTATVEEAKSREVQLIHELRPKLNVAKPKLRGCLPNPGSCPSQPLGSSSLAELVQDYIRRIRPMKRNEMSFYSAQPSLEAAIETAALARNSSGRRALHQRRLKPRALAKAHRRLRAVGLWQHDLFESLHDAIEEAILPIKGIGPLMVYDTSRRIGAFLGLEPAFVYLHAGTRKGARALGLRARGKTLRQADLPAEIHALTLAEAEDFLCVYKESFTGINERGRRPEPA